ncbi:Kielin/chordin-like protein [Halotydeus destructor]|nr:Kielin/chordin-like protein [Halotydeus destructor]
MLTLFLCQLIFTSSAAAFISGKAIKCLNEGENVKVSFLYNDPCIQCKCKNQEIVCEREACSQGKKCTHNGKVYKSGETWKNATCNHCTCSSGLIACQAEVCERDLTCHEKAKKVHLAGDCCPSCAENDGLCTLTSSGHDVNTLALKSFDDHRSNFSGQCNYVLARDCDKKTFVVHILRDRQANDTDTLFAIVVKVGQTKVRLSRTTTDKGWRLRVGRRPELLPHIKLGVLSVLKDDKGVLVRTNIGVKVTWSSDDVIAVTVPSKYKGKTCGLCGNYNELAEDDTLTKKGRKVDSYQRFFDSWKVGKVGACASVSRKTAAKETKWRPVCQ